MSSAGVGPFVFKKQNKNTMDLAPAHTAKAPKVG